MTKNKSDSKPASAASAREEKLKAALKANLQRRKAQARARKDIKDNEAE